MKVSAVLLLGVLLGGCCMLAAANEATWANANCDCTRERAIVCGDDGTSYLNKCWAECSGAAVAHDGACNKAEDVEAEENVSCPCTKERAIVCGADGHSYTNACWARCAHTYVIHQGPCSRALELPPCACTTERAIVCGADGHSYTNACWASCSGTSVAHDGACKKATQPTTNEGCDCRGVARLVCGADGKYYGSDCTMECAGVKEGSSCESCPVPLFFAPVCGKDGLTYANFPQLMCTGVELDHQGPCGNGAVANEAAQPTVNEGCDCHGDTKLVCGADGKNYATECTMRCAGVEKGDDCKPCVIPRIYIPTCGKDGITYINPMELQCTGVEQDHIGFCDGSDFTDDMLTSTECQKACPPVFEPVCGMNNKSYANKCRMECDGVELKHEGRCPIHPPSNEAAVANEATQPPCGCHGEATLPCGADGKLYGDECTMWCAGMVPADRSDACEKCDIPPVPMPVCGKDGLTYRNPWEMRCTGVEQDYPGPCKDDDVTDDMLTSECERLCAPVYDPVCGADNKSYFNKCIMECEGVKLKHEGNCNSILTI